MVPGATSAGLLSLLPPPPPSVGPSRARRVTFDHEHAQKLNFDHFEPAQSAPFAPSLPYRPLLVGIHRLLAMRNLLASVFLKDVPVAAAPVFLQKIHAL